MLIVSIVTQKELHMLVVMPKLVSSLTAKLLYLYLSRAVLPTVTLRVLETMASVTSSENAPWLARNLPRILIKGNLLETSDKINQYP